jgi:DNA modification methylase
MNTASEETILTEGILVPDAIVQGDCLKLMPLVPDHSVDLVLADLPYGTTQNQWDSVIPLEPLWAQYDRLLSKDGVVVLTAQGKFSAMLILAAPESIPYRYSAVWCKRNHTNQLNAKRQLLRKHEDVLVFYRGDPAYNPQGLVRKGTLTKQGKTSTTCYGEQKRDPYVQEWTNWPTTLIEVDGKTSRTHPTEKPLALWVYLMRTFSNEGGLVLDNCSGSGTTAVAARMFGRRFVCIEKDADIHAKSLVRLEQEAPVCDLFGSTIPGSS